MQLGLVTQDYVGYEITLVRSIFLARQQKKTALFGKAIDYLISKFLFINGIYMATFI